MTESTHIQTDDVLADYLCQLLNEHYNKHAILVNRGTLVAVISRLRSDQR